MRTYFPIEASMREGIAEELLKKGLDFTEEAMIRVLEDAAFDKFLKWKAAIGLRACGTLRCIPALQEVIATPNEDVRNTAILTIAHLATEPGIAFLVSLLDRKNLRKGVVLQALDAVDDTATVPAVIRFLSHTLKIDRRKSTVRIADVGYGLLFLDRHRDAFPEAQAILDGYVAVWDKFDMLVQRELSTQTATFRGMYNFRNRR